MPKETSRDIIPYKGGFFQDLVMRIKLILRLMSDRRVFFLLKLLPLAALVYLLSPWDLVPGLALPVIGALDDAAVIWIGSTLFVALCPDEVVEEHMSKLKRVIPGDFREPDEDEIIEATAHEVQEDPPQE